MIWHQHQLILLLNVQDIYQIKHKLYQKLIGMNLKNQKLLLEMRQQQFNLKKYGYLYLEYFQDQQEIKEIKYKRNQWKLYLNPYNNLDMHLVQNFGKWFLVLYLDLFSMKFNLHFNKIIQQQILIMIGSKIHVKKDFP